MGFRIAALFPHLLQPLCLVLLCYRVPDDKAIKHQADACHPLSIDHEVNAHEVFMDAGNA
jgi:hypothetical protein